MLKLRHHYRTMKNVGIYRYSVYITKVIAMVFLHYEAMEHMLNVSSYSDHFPPKTEKYTQKAV
jgi:hypothetical protein